MELTVDWWQCSQVGKGDSQYGIGSVYWEGFNRGVANSPGCFFFWDTGGLTLSIVTADGGATTTTVLVGPPPIDEIQNYRMEYSPGVDCKFYLNGVLVGTHTTDLPDGVAQTIYFGGGLDDNGVGQDELMMGPCTVSIDI